MDLNKVFLIGRACQKPELKEFNTGSKVVKFSLATNFSWSNKSTGEKKQLTEYHNIVIWGQLATIAAKYINKGSKIHVDGKIQTQKWEQDGVMRNRAEIVVDSFILLDSKNANTNKESADEAPQSDPVF